MHYGCRTSVGLKMQLSLELLTLEMGISIQPFQESYKRYCLWITNGWFKSHREEVDMFGITVEVCNIPLLQLRKRDKWIMMELKRKGHLMEYLRRLNRVRMHQQVLFLSDFLGPSGKFLRKEVSEAKRRGRAMVNLLVPKRKSPTQGLLVMAEVNCTANTGRRNYG